MGRASGQGIVAHGDFGLLNRIGYRALRAFTWLTIRPYFRIRLEGAGHLPDGPFIIAPNHASYLDPVVLQIALPRRLVFMMTLEWYEQPALKPFFRFMHCIAVDESARANRTALQAALAAIERGANIGIFPEGEVTTTGELGEFVPGVVSLAMRAHVPIVPAAIEGSYTALPKGGRLPRPARICVRLGAPLPPPSGDGADGRGRRTVQREFSARLRRAVSELLTRTPDA